MTDILAELFRAVRLVALLACLVTLTSLSATASAASESEPPDRLAIVIGNSNYDDPRYADLANAGNDAELVASTLQRLNFDVALAIDLKADRLESLFTDYEQKLGGYKAVVFFYAGHGLQVSGENYLLPIDAGDPTDGQRLLSRAIKLSDLTKRFASLSRQTLIFLDACRDNPLKQNGALNGLAQVSVGVNTFVAFATKPGDVTADGSGENSPFTKALARNMEVPGKDIYNVMLRVRNETEEATLGRQVPWQQDDLREYFYFTEQQVVDGGRITATLTRIRQDPVLSEQLFETLEAPQTDLQGTILMLGAQLPEPTNAKPAARPEQGKTVSAPLEKPTELQTTADDAKDAASELATLVIGNGETNSGRSSINTALLIQTELTRVGCYRNKVDGDWGPASRRALKEYLLLTKQEASALEPSVGRLGELVVRGGRIRREPIPVTKQVRTADNGKRDVRKGANRKSTARAGKRPEPPPPIGDGIGLGGIF